MRLLRLWMRIYRKDFFRARSKVESEGLARIRLYLNKPRFKGTSRAFAYTYVTEGLIVLRKSYDISYLDLTHCLLHEYGHILDYQENFNLFRWRIAAEYDTHDDNYYENVQGYSDRIKTSLLETEWVADEISKDLAKKYEIEFPENYIEIEQIVSAKARKYGIIFGKSHTHKDRKKWKKELQKNFKLLPKNYLTDFTYL